MVVARRPAARHRLLRRHHRRREVRAAALAEDAVRQALDAVPGREGGPELRRPGRQPGAGPPAAGRARNRAPASSRARAPSSSALQEAEPAASSRCSRQEIVGPVIGRDLQRKGIYATLASIAGITVYIAFRFRLRVRRRRHRRHAARRARHPGVPGVLRLRPVAQHRRGDPDHHRLLGERHHRHLRPGAREPARQDAPRLRSRRWSTPPSTRR